MNKRIGLFLRYCRGDLYVYQETTTTVMGSAEDSDGVKEDGSEYCQ